MEPNGSVLDSPRHPMHAILSSLRTRPAGAGAPSSSPGSSAPHQGYLGAVGPSPGSPSLDHDDSYGTASFDTGSSPAHITGLGGLPMSGRAHFSALGASSNGSASVSTPTKRAHHRMIPAYPSLYPTESAAAGFSVKVPLEEEEKYAKSSKKEKPAKETQVVVSRWNWVGLLLFLYYVSAAIYYFVIRATRTLNMGYVGYGNLVLAIEVISSTATLGYAVLLIRHTRTRPSRGLPLPRPGEKTDPLSPRFHVRVLIPCYTEPLETVRGTLLGALNADLPRLTVRTVYLCDDGKDKEKENLVGQLNQQHGDCVVYVTRERRRDAAGKVIKDVNGKSANLNNCLQNVIYKDYKRQPEAKVAAAKPAVASAAAAAAGQEGATVPATPAAAVSWDKDAIPHHEMFVILDADQVAHSDFFVRVLEVMNDDDVSLCLTPQFFGDVCYSRDIFNNSNLSFWEYMLPGTDGFGYVACTGTNFCLRSRAAADVNWFPDFSVTEDYTLGMELKAKGYKARYLNQYLVVGEAPGDPRGVFKQRSRWCKGQMQILFSKHCPLFDLNLSLGMRLLYTSVTWSYITNALAVPCSVLVPFIALVFGIYPLVLNRDFALAATLYYSSSTLVTMYCTDRKHLKPLWFCIVSCHILWFTFTKAMINVFFKQIFNIKLDFKVTEKKKTAAEGDEAAGKEKRPPFWFPRNLGDMAGTLDGWVLLGSFTISFITAAVGLFQMIDKPFTAQGEVRWFLALSIFWSVYNMLAPSLFLFYIYENGLLLDNYCSFCYVLSFLMAIGGIACTWLVPDDYNLGQVLNVSLQFFEAQRSGKLPRISNTPWRGNSGLWDSVIVNGRNYSLMGGWHDDGGMVKLSYTTAFTVSMLSWAYWEFKGGYRASSNLDFGANTIRWGADYLMKATIATNVTGSTASQLFFVAQVGDVAKDRLYWGSPEKATMARPAYALSPSRPGTDVVAMGAAGLAAAAVAIQSESQQLADQYISKATALYQAAQRSRGSYTAWSKTLDSAKAYPSVSFFDDLSYAAGWMYLATGSDAYLNDAVAYYQQALKEAHVSPNPYEFNYENVVPALHLLLFKATRDPTYRAAAQDFVREWMNTRSKGGDILYTPKALAKAVPGGNLQHTANAAFYVLLAASEGVMGSRFMLYACWARDQIGYMLGDAGRSYVTGYGAVQPLKTPHKAASCPPPDVSDCTWESAYFTTDPNFHPLRGGLVGGPDDSDAWADDRDMNNVANTVSLLNSAGLSAALAGLVAGDINMAKCQQGNGFIQALMLKARGMPDAAGQRWWELGA